MTVLRSLFWWRPPCLLRVVIVNLMDDSHTAIRGVLWSARGPWLILRQASLLKVGGGPTELAGDVVIERARVSFLQALP